MTIPIYQRMTRPRVLLAKGGLDGHDRPAIVVANELRELGFHVIYGGMYQSPDNVACVALQEDVDIIGISIHSGEHMYFFRRLSELLGDQRDEFLIWAGGIIPAQDREELCEQYGVSAIFDPGNRGTLRDEIIAACDELPKREHNHPSVSSIQEGDTWALARFISRLEDGNLRHRAQKVFSWTWDSLKERPLTYVVGLGGQGGAGKSTLLARIVEHIAREKEDPQVGVICVDPTSVSGGAFLADRVRMDSQTLLENPGIFVRSLASPNPKYGVTRAIRDIIKAMALAGKDRVFVESVGLGQHDEGFGSVVDTHIYVTSPSMGDEMQVLKGGGIETADIVVLSHYDQRGADDMEGYLQDHIARTRDDGWTVPIIPVVGVATDSIGQEQMTRLMSAIADHQAFLKK